MKIEEKATNAEREKAGKETEPQKIHGERKGRAIVYAVESLQGGGAREKRTKWEGKGLLGGREKHYKPMSVETKLVGKKLSNPP